VYSVCIDLPQPSTSYIPYLVLRLRGDTTNVNQGCSDVRDVFLCVGVSVVVVISNPRFTPTLTPFETATRVEELHRVQRFCT
jgi:hypothetical protein